MVPKSLNQEKLFGNIQYPKTTTDSTNIQSNHEFDQNKNLKQSNSKPKNGKKETEKIKILQFHTTNFHAVRRNMLQLR